MPCTTSMLLLLMLIQNNAIDILTKCDELRKQFMPMRWEVSLLHSSRIRFYVFF